MSPLPEAVSQKAVRRRPVGTMLFQIQQLASLERCAGCRSQSETTCHHKTENRPLESRLAPSLSLARDEGVGVAGDAPPSRNARFRGVLPGVLLSQECCAAPSAPNSLRVRVAADAGVLSLSCPAAPLALLACPLTATGGGVSEITLAGETADETGAVATDRAGGVVGTDDGVDFVKNGLLNVMLRTRVLGLARVSFEELGLKNSEIDRLKDWKKSLVFFSFFLFSK
mmetsp:Transcript_6840/g.13428  ORF Transcript_6840/g.13428 Transcript_6840/m.13428 type:complete len:227 (+) Transcript_6840:1589-2269(+)